MKRLVTLGLISMLSVFMLGCNNNAGISNEDNSNKVNTEIIKENPNKITIKDSLTEAQDKMYKAYFYDNKDKAAKTKKDAMEYIKDVLPDGVEEIENTYLEDKGVTQIKYSIKDMVFYVCLVHPYNGLEDNNDLDSVSGITFPRIEINIDSVNE